MLQNYMIFFFLKYIFVIQNDSGMHFKTFYLIALFGTSFLSGLYLISIWMKRKNTSNIFLKESNIALLLIALTFQIIAKFNPP